MVINQISYLNGEDNSLSPLSSEVRLALTLMGADERVRLTQIAAYFAQDPNKEEGEDIV